MGSRKFASVCFIRHFSYALSLEKLVRTESVTSESELHGTNIKVSMKSLSATLNKEQYPLAKAVVSNLSFDVEQRGPDQQVDGSIGYISLSDMSPHGSLYRERFMAFLCCFTFIAEYSQSVYKILMVSE